MSDFKTIYEEQNVMKIKINKQKVPQKPQSTREMAILALRELKKHNIRQYKRKKDAKN